MIDDIFRKNIETINQYNKYNIRALNKLKNYKGKNNNYKLKQIKNNLFSILYNNKPLTSTYAPIEEAKRLISQFVKDNNEHIGIFLSIASFYHIDYFLSLNENNIAIIIEKDIEIAKLILCNIYINKNIILILDERYDDIISFFNFYINDNNVKKITYIRHIRASNINSENTNYYDNINMCLINIIKEKLMSLTSNYYFAPIWSRNILYNMHLNKGYSVKTYSNILKKEIPILLVSAGASIDKHINDIKELSKTHFIIALSHSLNTLINNDIKPNVVVSTDGGFYSSIHLINLIKEENKDIKIFTTHSAYPFPLTNIDDERIFYFSHNESFEKILYKIDNENNIFFYMEGSVIMPALRIANMLNPKYIVLAGCDFCYIDDKSHSIYSSATTLDFISSSKLKTFETLKYNKLNNREKILCYDKNYRNSSNQLISYKNHFETLIKKLINNKINIFTLTKESAKIDDVKMFDFNISNENKNYDIKIDNYLEESLNKKELVNNIKNFVHNQNMNLVNKELANMISPWHIDELEKSKITYNDFKTFINKWYDDIKILLN